MRERFVGVLTPRGTPVDLTLTFTHPRIGLGRACMLYPRVSSSPLQIQSETDRPWREGQHSDSSKAEHETSRLRQRCNTSKEASGSFAVPAILLDAWPAIWSPKSKSPPASDEKPREKSEKKQRCCRYGSVAEPIPSGETGQHENREQRQRVTWFAYQETG